MFGHTPDSERIIMMKKLTILLLALCLSFVLFSCGDCDHADANTDGKCDECGNAFGTCTHDDADDNGTCDKCGAEVSMELNCKHSYFKVIVTEATCTEGATYYDKCTKCGNSTEIKNDQTPRSHNWQQIQDEDCLVSPATCYSKATYSTKCTLCGSTEGDLYYWGVILEHEYKVVASVENLREPANCQHGNLFASICTHCGHEHSTLVEIGHKARHSDSHGDDVCDGCGMPLEEWDDIPSDNKTDIAPLSREEEN